MEAQIKQLKLNSINIKNTLFNKNKELKKLRLQERNLFNQQQSERKKEQRETALEAKGTGGGVLGSIGSRLLSGPMSLFDKIKEFFGNILLGILVNNLPRIFAAIQKFLDENKWLVQTIKEVIKFTGNAIMGFINVFNSAKDIIGELGDTVKKIESGLQELSDLANGIANQVSIFNNDVLGLGKEFEDEFKDVVKEDVIEAIKQSGGNGTPPITRRQFVKKSDEYRRAKSSGGITREIVVPGIGSYQRTSPKGLFGMGEKEIAKDASGMEIDPKEFDRRYNYMVGSQNEIFNTLRDEKIPGYSRGGTVKQQYSTGSGTKSFSGESGTARKARESTQSFVRFENNAIAQSEIIGIQEETNKSFEELIKNFKGLYREDKLPNISPFTLPTPDPKQQGPISPPPGTGSPSSPMIDQSGEPGVDFTPAGSNNRAVFAGEVVEIGHQYNPGRIGGDGRLGSGYGNYVVIRSEDPNNPGKYFDGLYAHFPDGEIKVSQGQKVQKGDILGRMATAAEYGNPKTRPRVGSGTGAHTSLDFLNPGSNQAYSNWRGLVPLVDTSFGSSNVKPKKPEGGGRLNELSQSFDSSGGEVVMIMAQQPIIVPGPTRYITRTMTQVMPVAVPIAPKTSGLRELV
jgi:murein DD-endopeptidase MepM/ murein hydrolase activator NlpD